MNLFNFFAQRRTAYVRTFLCPPGQEVLTDLAKFCRANESTYSDDPRAHAVAEGRREVWLRIQRHLQLTDDQLWQFYTQSLPTPKKE
jgi:hypothetical protein